MNLEIILVDDGSPDNCGKICNEYLAKDSRIRVFHTENCGVSSARNIGLDKSNGEYIGFVDSDDWIEADMYQQLYNAILANNCDMAICGYDLRFDDFTRSMLPETKTVIAKTGFLEAFCSLQFPGLLNGPCNKLYKSIYLHSGQTAEQNVRFPIGITHGEDTIFVFRYVNSIQNGIVFVDSCYYHYLSGSENIGSLTKQGYDQYVFSLCKMHSTLFSELLEFFPGQKIEIQRARKLMHAQMYLEACAMAMIYREPLPLSKRLKIRHLWIIFTFSKSRNTRVRSLLVFFLPALLYRKAYILFLHVERLGISLSELAKSKIKREG